MHSNIPTLPSLLDNDFYKLTMQHAVIKLFPYAKARYQFINRGRHPFPPHFAEQLKTGSIAANMVSIKYTKASSTPKIK